MTEEKEVYFEDLKWKNDVKKSARKKNRTGRGAVRLSQNNMTKKEWEKMNGECVVWNLNGFYTWKDFVRMPDDIKISWINRMLNVYGVRLNDISKVVLGRDNPGALSNWLCRHPDIKKYINVPRKGTLIKQSDYDRFVKAVDTWRNPVTEPEPIANEDPSEAPKDDDWSDEEKRFINTYIAPLSAPKKVPEPTAVTEVEHVEETTATEIESEICDASDTPIVMSHMEFSMNGFDMEFIAGIQKLFGDQPIRVCMSVYAEKTI